MKTISKTILMLGVLAFFATPAFAADATAVKYAVVDMKRVMNDTDAGKAVIAEINGKEEEFRAQLKKEFDSLEASRSQLEKDHAKMSKEDLDSKVKDLMKKQADNKKMVEDRSQKLRSVEASAEKYLIDQAKSVIAEIAKERSLDTVFTQEAVILASNSLDITDEVLSRMNKSVKKVPVEWKK